MYKKPLVAFDESSQAQKALGVGMDLARTLGVDLASITVEENLPPYVMSAAPFVEYASSPIMDEIQESRDAYYKALLEAARERAAAGGVTLHAALVAGDEVDAIVEYARDHQHDLIIVGFHPHSALSDRLLGSTAHGITMRSPCCVLSVK